MEQQEEFRLTSEQQKNLEAIFGALHNHGKLNAKEYPKETLDALLSTLRKRLSERMDAYAPLKSAIQEASGVLLPLTCDL